MLKKIAKFAIVASTLLFVFLPGAILAQDDGGEVAPTPIFQGGDNAEKSGVAGIECALVSGAANQETPA